MQLLHTAAAFADCRNRWTKLWLSEMEITRDWEKIELEHIFWMPGSLLGFVLHKVPIWNIVSKSNSRMFFHNRFREAVTHNLRFQITDTCWQTTLGVPGKSRNADNWNVQVRKILNKTQKYSENFNEFELFLPFSGLEIVHYNLLRIIGIPLIS